MHWYLLWLYRHNQTILSKWFNAYFEKETLVIGISISGWQFRPQMTCSIGMLNLPAFFLMHSLNQILWFFFDNWMYDCNIPKNYIFCLYLIFLFYLFVFLLCASFVCVCVFVFAQKKFYQTNFWFPTLTVLVTYPLGIDNVSTISLLSLLIPLGFQNHSHPSKLTQHKTKSECH